MNLVSWVVGARGKSLPSPLGMLTGLSLLVALYFALVYAPTEATMGHVQRIFYFHVALAWIALLAFAVVFVGSVGYLRTKAQWWDALAHSSAGLGVLFTSLAIITGSLWAKPAWGTWWTWDPRLTTTLVLWLIYIAYVLLRQAVDEPQRRAAFAAVVGIVGFVDVPIVFMSIRWWRSIHPVVVESSGFQMATEMVTALWVAVGAFTLLYLYLLALRVSLEGTKTEIEAAARRLECPV